MAKRFTDSELFDRAWFRKLPPRLKCAWEYIRSKCDVVGVWNVDMDKLSWEVGETVTLEEMREHFQIDIFDEDKVFIPGFVPFQYGDDSGRLSPKNKFHLSIAQKLESRGLPRPIFKPIEMDFQSIPTGADTVSTVVGTPQGQGKGRGQGKGKEEGDARGNSLAGEVAACMDDWRTTLQHFKIDRGIGLHDQVEITRAVQAFGAKWVKLAFAGARKQKPGKNYDPAQFVSLRLYLDPKRIERLVNIGAGKESADGLDWGNFLGGAA